MTEPWVEGSGPTLLLLPGLDGTARLFSAQVPRLARHFRVVGVPLPAARSLAELVEHVRAQLDRFSADAPAIVFGESFGGALALSLVLAHPERVRGLVLLNTFARVPYRVGLTVWARLARLLPPAPLRRWLRGPHRWLLNPTLAPDELDLVYAATDGVSGAELAARMLLLRDYDVRDRLCAITVPVLLLAGDRDRLLPSVKEARAMAARLPRPTVQVLSGCGHICLVRSRLDVAEMIAEWVAGSLEAHRARR